jgi:hypothetical protein
MDREGAKVMKIPVEVILKKPSFYLGKKTLLKDLIHEVGF